MRESLSIAERVGALIDRLNLIDILKLGLLSIILSFSYVIYTEVNKGVFGAFFSETIAIEYYGGCILKVERDNHYLYLPTEISGEPPNLTDSQMVVMFLSRSNEFLATEDFETECRTLRRAVRLLDENLKNE